MELTVTLAPGEEKALQRLAKRLGTDLEGAVSFAIRESAGDPAHPRLVKAAVERVLERDRGLLERLA